MKKITMILAALGMAACLAGTTAAQEAADAEAIQPQRRVVRTIFSYRQELGLTEAQEKQITDTLLALQKDLIEKRAKLGVAQIELRQLVSDRAELPAIKAKLEQVSALSVDISFTDISASRKIEQVLSAEQLRKWRAIQAEARQGQ